MNIQILGIKGCGSTPKTVELVKSVANSMGINIDLQIVTIETPEQAREEHFIGSPTVKINGLDIEPAARDVKFFGIT